MTEAETLALLYYSERELWFDCYQARPVLARLARYRKAERARLVVSPDGAFKRLLRRLVGPLTGDIVPCRACGSVEEGHDQCGEGMQMQYEWRN